MKTIDEIFELKSWEERITLIRKSRRTPQPDVKKLKDLWYPERHRVHDQKFRKNMRTLVKDGYIDTKGKEIPPEFEEEEVARISLPIEQDITNIHVAFTVGNEPDIQSDTEDVHELDVLKLVKKICKNNKLRYVNKREVRSWLSQQEVCEYWYRVEDNSFWRKVWKKIGSLVGIKVQSNYRMKMQMWCPFNGDKLYPLFSDEGDDYLGVGREYEIRLADGNTKKMFMLVTNSEVYQLEITGESADGWTLSEGYPFKHGFSKNPTIYSFRSEPLCKDIEGARESLETLTSDYSDAIKMNFFPKLILEGDLANGGAQNIGKSHLLKITGGGKAYYLDWHQTSDMVKTQMDNLLTRCYSLTDTPLISFDQLKGSGVFPSGTSFEFMFMAILFAVDRHWEDMGEFFQRRVNFLTAAVGDLVASLKPASETLETDVVQKPYRIEDLTKRIDDATKAFEGGVMSRKNAVMLVGIADDYKDEMEQIEKESASKGSSSE